MTESRARAIRKMVRKQIIEAIQNDLDGDETLMKEVFEAMYDDLEQEVCYDEMRGVIETLKA